MAEKKRQYGQYFTQGNSVVCDLTAKVKKWLEPEKDFNPMPDGLGWFRWHGNINLYVEVISWDKILKDAGMRNRIFSKNWEYRKTEQERKTQDEF